MKCCPEAVTCNKCNRQLCHPGKSICKFETVYRYKDFRWCMYCHFESTSSYSMEISLMSRKKKFEMKQEKEATELAKVNIAMEERIEEERNKEITLVWSDE